MRIDKYIEQGSKHLDIEFKRAKHCPICKTIDFPVREIIDDWMSKPSRAYDISIADKRFIISELMRYKLPSNICQIETHHISYEMEITMPLCIKCHKKVHNSDESPWCKYKPIDKRLVLKQQKEPKNFDK